MNILIRHLTEKQHIQLIALCALIYVFFGTVPFCPVTMNYVSWFAVLYFIASYIRLYPKQIFERKKVWGWMTFICAGLSCASVIVCAWVGKQLDRHMAYYFVTDSNTLLAVCTAISAFLLFKYPCTIQQMDQLRSSNYIWCVADSREQRYDAQMAVAGCVE